MHSSQAQSRAQTLRQAAIKDIESKFIQTKDPSITIIYNAENTLFVFHCQWPIDHICFWTEEKEREREREMNRNESMPFIYLFILCINQLICLTFILNL